MAIFFFVYRFFFCKSDSYKMRYYMILKLTTLNLFYFILFHSITSTLFVKRTSPILAFTSRFHLFFKSKKVNAQLKWQATDLVSLLMRVSMLDIKELYNLETTAIDIEMNISLIIIRGMCFPCFSSWIGCFKRLPYFLANTFTLNTISYIEQL